MVPTQGTPPKEAELIKVKSTPKALREELKVSESRGQQARKRKEEKELQYVFFVVMVVLLLLPR